MGPALPLARRAGPGFGKSTSSKVRSYATPDSAPQRPITRRRPNAPFADDLIPASELESLCVGVAGGADRRLLELIVGVAQ
jgi:hypothetical protein